MAVFIGTGVEFLSDCGMGVKKPLKFLWWSYCELFHFCKAVLQVSLVDMGNIFKIKINFGAHKKQVLELNVEFSMISVSDWLVSISCFLGIHDHDIPPWPCVQRARSSPTPCGN